MKILTLKTSFKLILTLLCVLILPKAYAIPITVEVNWPSWSSENRVRIYNSGGSIIRHSGPAPTNRICDTTNCYNGASDSSYSNTYTYDIPVGTGYSIRMDDSHGDGWNGVSYVRVYNGSTLIYQDDGPATNTQTEQFNVLNGGSSAINCGTDNGSGYATSGTGAFKNNIVWLDWSCNAATQFSVGNSYVKSWNKGNGLVVTATLSNITANIAPYNSGDWSGDVLHDLYSGVNPIGLTNVISGQDPQFDINFSATYNGNSIPATIVAADAEDEGFAAESLEVTSNGSAWQPIEAHGSLSAQFTNGGKTLTLVDLQNSGSGTLLALSENTSTINTRMRTGGKGAVAFGIFVNFDYGDANGIPSGRHYLNASASGGSQPTSSTPVTSLTLANVQYGADLYLGTNLTDPETAHQPNASATGDNSNGTDDESGITFPILYAGDTIYTILSSNFTTGAGNGNLYAWIDFDGNGTFDPDEFASTTVANGAVQGNLDFSAYGSTMAAGTTFARFRLTTNILNNTDVSSPATNGEVEDYLLNVAPISGSTAPICGIKSDMFNNWASGDLNYTENNIDGSGVNLSVAVSGETTRLATIEGGAFGGVSGLDLRTNGFLGTGATFTYTFSQNLDSVNFAIGHINRTDPGGAGGDSYTITALDSLGNTVYPNFTISGSSYTANAATGTVDANGQTPAILAISFTDPDLIKQVIINWNDCSNCNDSFHGGAFSEMDLCLPAQTPKISLLKSVKTLQDPINGTTNPKAIPGALAEYSIEAKNTGNAAADNNTIILTDVIPANTALYVGDISGPGTGPIRFIDGTPPSGLAYNFTNLASSTDNMSFSNNNGTSFNYTPSADAEGVDTSVTNIRMSPTGQFSASSGAGDPSFKLLFRVKVQ